MLDLKDSVRLEALHRAAEAGGAAQVPVDTLIAAAAKALRFQAYATALDVLEGALVLDPAHERAWALAGIALEKLDREAEARVAYERALALESKDPVTGLALACLYARGGENEKARALAGWVIASSDDAPEVRKRAQLLEKALPAGGAG